jgi:hypothetical protein
VAVCLPVALASAALQGSEPQTEPRGMELVVRTLRDSRMGRAPAKEVLVERIAEAVQENLDDVFSLLFERRVPALTAEEEPQRLSEPQTEMLTDAIRRIERRSALDRLEAFLIGQKGLEARALEIEVLGCVGLGEDLGRVLTSALRTGEAELDPTIESKSRWAIARILRADPRGYDVLLESWRQFQPALLPMTIFAVGDAGDARGVEVLEDLATWKPDVALQAIGQVRRLGRSPSQRVNTNMILTTRRYLDPERPDRCQTVILALGELEDQDSIPTLISLLETGTRGLRQSVVWSLRRMSGMGFGESVKLWRRWYAEEKAWQLEQRDRVFEELRSPSRSRATAAIKEIARHRLDRHELAADLADQLFWLPTDLWPLTCHVLGQLGSPRAAPVLVEVLLEEDSSLAEASRSALRRITGQDRGLDSQAWNEFFRR